MFIKNQKHSIIQGLKLQGLANWKQLIKPCHLRKLWFIECLNYSFNQ